MKIWHKKRALTWPSELGERLLISSIFSFNSTLEGRWIQW